jgi:YggT family protein
MNQAVIFLLETFLGLFIYALLLRFFLQTVRAPARNPLSYFLASLTDFIVRPARRVVPGLWGYDLSTLSLAWLGEVILISLVSLLASRFGPEPGSATVAVCLLAVVDLFRRFLIILMVCVFAQAILSFVSRYNPAMPILNCLTRPFLQVFQRRIPPVGNVDLSPLFVLVICQVLLMWPVESVRQSLERML